MPSRLSRFSRKRKILAFIQEADSANALFATNVSKLSKMGFGKSLGSGAKKVGGFVKRNPIKSAAIGTGGYLAYKGARKLGQMVGIGKKKNKLQSARDRLSRKFS